MKQTQLERTLFLLNLPTEPYQSTSVLLEISLAALSVCGSYLYITVE